MLPCSPVGGVVGAVEGQVTQGGELGLDTVEPGGVRRRVGDFDVVRGGPVADALALLVVRCGEKLSQTIAIRIDGG